MYGGFVTPANDDWADLGVVFFHNEGYSTACGHGTIALVTWAVETGRVASAPGTRSVGVTVDVPSGRLPCTARLDEDGQVEAVRFRNVPSFLLARDVTVRLGDRLLTLDVAFGGAFYGRWRPPRSAFGSTRPISPSSSTCNGSCGRHSSARSQSSTPTSPISPASTA